MMTADTLAAPRFTQRLQRGLGGTGLAWVVLCALELALSRELSLSIAPLFVAGVLGLYALVALLAVTAFGSLGARLGIGAPMQQPDPRTTLATLGVALLSALAGYLPLRLLAAQIVSRDYAELPRLDHMAAAGAATALGALVGVYFVMRHRGTRPPLLVLGLLWLCLVASIVEDYRVVSNGRDSLLLLSSAGVLVVAFERVSLHVRIATRLQTALGFAMLGCIGLLGILGSHAADRARVARHHDGVSELLRWTLVVADLDGDGFPGALGGADCNDDDPNINPMALELVANGIDDNCSGADLQTPQILDPDVVRQLPRAPRNVILLSVDALRADALRAAGPGEPLLMPNLSRLAQAGARFDNAYVSAPVTGNSLQSIMTGRFPMTFNGPRGEWLGTDPTLAERLRALGYQTLVQHQVWTSDHMTGERLDPNAWSVYAGFEEVDDSLAALNRNFRGVTSDETTRRFIRHLARLRTAGRPYLAWVHYMDPHEEYMPHEGTPFAGDSLSRRYFQEVFATDRALGPLFNYLQQSRFFDDGLLVVFSDHGEHIGEGGEHGHARWVDEAVLRGVLILRGADVPRVVVRTRVRLVDLHATVLELAAGSHASTDGRSLTTTFGGGEPDRDVFVQNTYGGVNMRVVISGHHKLVEQVLYGASSLYDLQVDPNEQRNLVDARPDLVAQLRRRMGERWDLAMNTTMLSERARREALHECEKGNQRVCETLTVRPER